MRQIIREVSSRDLSEMKTDSDATLFSYLMLEVKQIDDINLARELHANLDVGNNRVFLARKTQADGYYMDYLELCLKHEPIDAFMATFVTIVPHVYAPSMPWTYLKVLEAHANDYEGRWHHFARLWSDASLAKYAGGRVDVLERFMAVALKADVAADETAAAQAPAFVAMAREALEKTQLDAKSRSQGRSRDAQPSPAASRACDAAVRLALRHGEYALARDVFLTVREVGDGLAGDLTAEAVERLCAAALDDEDTTTAMAVVEYAHKLGMPNTLNMAKELRGKKNLNSFDLKMLNQMFQNEVEWEQRV